MKKVDLSRYDNTWFSPRAGILKRLAWHYSNAIFFNSALFPINSLKILLLQIFGATIGKGVIIKPSVNIKYPWLLEIGDNSWIGEYVWIDNLVKISIGANCCLSQGSMLLTGNHDYKSEIFDLKVKSIVLEDGVWIGAKALVAPGITCHTHSVLSAYSFAVNDLKPYKIYKGNPAEEVKGRIIL